MNDTFPIPNSRFVADISNYVKSTIPGGTGNAALRFTAAQQGKVNEMARQEAVNASLPDIVAPTRDANGNLILPSNGINGTDAFLLPGGGTSSLPLGNQLSTSNGSNFNQKDSFENYSSRSNFNNIFTARNMNDLINTIGAGATLFFGIIDSFLSIGKAPAPLHKDTYYQDGKSKASGNNTNKEIIKEQPILPNKDVMDAWMQATQKSTETQMAAFTENMTKMFEQQSQQMQAQLEHLNAFINPEQYKLEQSIQKYLKEQGIKEPTKENIREIKNVIQSSGLKFTEAANILKEGGGGDAGKALMKSVQDAVQKMTSSPEKVVPPKSAAADTDADTTGAVLDTTTTKNSTDTNSDSSAAINTDNSSSTKANPNEETTSSSEKVDTNQLDDLDKRANEVNEAAVKSFQEMVKSATTKESYTRTIASIDKTLKEADDGKKNLELTIDSKKKTYAEFLTIIKQQAEANLKSLDKK